MGLFKKKSKKDKTGQSDHLHLAFVLLPDLEYPSPENIVPFFNEITAKKESIKFKKESSKEGVFLYEFNSKESGFIAYVPDSVPNNEADEGTQFSVSAMGNGWTLPEHKSHFVVTATLDKTSSKVDQLKRFTSLIAAVSKASHAVGIYWGNAGATHEPEFFISIAETQEVIPQIMLWSGISIVREKDGRLSLLSLGMKQLNLPELLLVVSQSSSNIAVEYFYELLAYLASRGSPIPEGETVGRTPKEKLKVHYVQSPIDRKQKVWRVELP